MRTVDAAGMLVTQARCSVEPHGTATLQLFVRDGPATGPTADSQLLLPLLRQLLHAIAQPVSVAVRPRFFYPAMVHPSRAMHTPPGQRCGCGRI